MNTINIDDIQLLVTLGKLISYKWIGELTYENKQHFYRSVPQRHRRRSISMSDELWE